MRLGKMRRLRNSFVAGLIVLVPVITTVFFLRILFRLADGILEPLLGRLIGSYVPGLGVATTIVLIFLTGLVATDYFGARLIHAAELLLTKMPLIRGIYGTSKQMVDAFFHPETTPLKKVCMVEYPRRGIYTIGFVTNELPRDTGEDAETMVSIFVAATPNPTFGFYIIVPKHDVTFLDMGVDEGLKMVVSGGIITPRGARLFKKNDNPRHLEQG